MDEEQPFPLVEVEIEVEGEMVDEGEEKLEDGDSVESD
jgi:hypothetical protein